MLCVAEIGKEDVKSRETRDTTGRENTKKHSVCVYNTEQH